MDEVTIRVRVNNDTESGLALVRRSIDSIGSDVNSRLSRAGRTGGMDMMDEITRTVRSAADDAMGDLTTAATRAGGSAGEAFNGGFTGVLSTLAKNPELAAAAVGIGLVLASAIAVVVGGAIILALGGAFTAVGAIAVAGTKPVKKAWTDAFADIKKKITDAAGPLIPVLVLAAKLAEKVVDVFAPVFKSTFKEIQPSLEAFLKALATAVLAFKPAIKPIMEAFATLLKALGPMLPIIATSLANALIKLANEFAKPETAQVFAQIISDILILLTSGIVNTITFLVEQFMKLVPAWDKLSKSPYGKYLKGVAEILGLIVKIGIIAFFDGLALAMNIAADASTFAEKAVKAAWNGIKTGVTTAYNWLHKNVFTPIANFFTKTIPNAAKTVSSKVVGAWNSVKSGVSSAYKWLVKNVFSPLSNFFTKTIPNAGGKLVSYFAGMPHKISNATKGMFNGIVSAFKAAINTIIRAWNGLSFHIPGISVGPVHFGGFTLSTPNIPLLAHGGISSGGMAMVGENGPEFVKLPNGAHVKSNADSRSMGMAACKHEMTVYFEKSGDPLIDALFDIMRKQVRTKYGKNVERAFTTG